MTTLDAAGDGVATRPEVRGPEPRLELASVIVLSLTTVASAWSGYQATRWSGLMAIAFSEASAARVQAAQARARADQKLAMDVQLFTGWLEAKALEQQELTEFMEARFRPEFSGAFQEWLATKPGSRLEGSDTPFDLASYAPPERLEARALEAQADARADDARTYNQVGDGYVLTTVLFASVLFFGGISTKAGSRGVQRALLLVALVTFLVGTAILASFPVH